jgi:hypothetical protein
MGLRRKSGDTNDTKFRCREIVAIHSRFNLTGSGLLRIVPHE